MRLLILDMHPGKDVYCYFSDGMIFSLSLSKFRFTDFRRKYTMEPGGGGVYTEFLYFNLT